MLTHAPEEPSLVTLLRKTMTRLRDVIPRAGAETPLTEIGAETKDGQAAEVPLVLPFDKERRLMPRLLRRLRRRRFLRYCPDTLNEYAPLTPYAADYFLERLRNPRIDAWRECVAATWALGRLTVDDAARPEAEQILVGLVTAKLQIDGRAMDRLCFVIFQNLFVTLTLAGEIVLLTTQPGSGMDRFSVFIQAPFFAAFVACFLFVPAVMLTMIVNIPLGTLHMNRIRAMAVLTLGRWREPHHLDLFLREFVGRRGRTGSAAETALREVLPLLKAGEEIERAADFVPNLCRALQRKERQVLDYNVSEENLEVLLLESLGKVGDGRALPTVARIAQRGRTPRLQALAQRILPLVQARSRQATDPGQLLRGAVRPDPASDVLLRAAHETSTPPEQLLRPHGACGD
ncbi:MAG: hypothetical protein JWL77_2441 [Chthonomonadaceae bacterium]|nr:hypothetical protein [Chthonomonadaceae bacterium]